MLESVKDTLAKHLIKSVRLDYAIGTQGRLNHLLKILPALASVIAQSAYLSKGLFVISMRLMYLFLHCHIQLHVSTEIPYSHDSCGKCRPSLQKDVEGSDAKEEYSIYLLIHSNCPLSSLKGSQRAFSRT